MWSSRVLCPQQGDPWGSPQPTPLRTQDKGFQALLNCNALSTEGDKSGYCGSGLSPGHTSGTVSGHLFLVRQQSLAHTSCLMAALLGACLLGAWTEVQAVQTFRNCPTSRGL